ncbi:MAG: hypothetical protein JRJ03_19915, partial [Deltaproteobacteria bacterium]|nr:hypothetical protein [Deltaproteobacteria bacterium]
MGKGDLGKNKQGLVPRSTASRGKRRCPYPPSLCDYDPKSWRQFVNYACRAVRILFPIRLRITHHQLNWWYEEGPKMGPKRCTLFFERWKFEYRSTKF